MGVINVCLACNILCVFRSMQSPIVTDFGLFSAFIIYVLPLLIGQNGCLAVAYDVGSYSVAD